METQLPMLFMQNIFATCWIYVGSARVRQGPGFPVFVGSCQGPGFPAFLGSRQGPGFPIFVGSCQGPGFLVFVGSRWGSTRVPGPGFPVSRFILFLTIKYLRMFNMSRAKIRLDEDVLKTSSEHFFKTSSRRLHQDEYNRHTPLEDVIRSLQDVLVNTNIFVLAIHLQEIFKTFSRRLQGVFKKSCQDVFKTFSRHLQDVLQKHFQDIFKTSRRCLEDVLQKCF